MMDHNKNGRLGLMAAALVSNAAFGGIFSPVGDAENPFSHLQFPNKASPGLGDLTGDGLPELMVWVDSTFWYYYRNEGQANQPLWVRKTGSENPFFASSGNAGFSLSDVDQDGRVDVQLDAQYFLKNNGSLQSPFMSQKTFIPGAIPQGGSGGGYAANLSSAPGDEFMIYGSVGIAMYAWSRAPAQGGQFYPVSGKQRPFVSVPFTNTSESRLLVGDVDGDGLKDLLILSTGGGVFFFANMGTQASPYFVERDSRIPFSGDLPFGVSGGCFYDLDGDGDQDLLIGGNDGKLRYYRNDPVRPRVTGDSGLVVDRNHHVQYAATSPSPVSAAATLVYQSLDALEESGPGGSVSQQFLIPNGATSGIQDVSIPTTNLPPVTVGPVHMLLADGPSGENPIDRRYVLGVGQIHGLRFEDLSKRTHSLGGTPAVPQAPFLAGDFNGDGLVDVLAHLQGPGLSLLTGTTLDTLNVENPASAHLDTLEIFPGDAMAITDLDLDGDLDLLSLRQGQLLIHENVGNPGFPSFRTLLTGGVIPGGIASDLQTLACADLDGDTQDEWVLQKTTGEWVVLRNAGPPRAPQFVPDPPLASTLPPHANVPMPGMLLLADVDGDLDADLLIVGNGLAPILFSNEGSPYQPLFSIQPLPGNGFQDLPAAHHPALALVHVNPDRFLDAAQVDASGNVVIWTNTTDVFWNHVTEALGPIQFQPGFLNDQDENGNGLNRDLELFFGENPLAGSGGSNLPSFDGSTWSRPFSTLDHFGSFQVVLEKTRDIGDWSQALRFPATIQSSNGARSELLLQAPVDPSQAREFIRYSFEPLPSP